MTTLSRTLRRRVPGGRRGFVVILHPGAAALVEVREARRRRGFSIPVASLYTILAQREAERARAEKRAARRKRIQLGEWR